MFYRIFYTSWPQLLEAGRGGFGIVARHREIPTVISHAAEAASQFAPLRGEAVHRVVYAYRTETAQSGRWHILSRIEDSGSDYTGRTNYLAQHLVASDEVARSLASQGISPAMVMGAPDAWPVFDRQVGFITDPPWQVEQAPPREGYWAHFGDGNTERRFLLAAGSSVTLVYPPHPHWQNSAAAKFILGLYDEAACSSRADCGWGTTFTTYLEPTDKSQDFCWIGLPADSALLPKLRDTGRPIITETTPPPARQAAAAISPSNKHPVPLSVGEGGSNTKQPSPVSLRGSRPLLPTDQTSTRTSPLTSSDPSWPRRVLGPKWKLFAAAAVVCIGLIAWWIVSSAMSSSRPHGTESLKVTYGEFNSETVQRFLAERKVPRDAKLQYREAKQQEWKDQLPQDAGDYEIQRIIRRWLPFLPDKERKLPYTLTIDKVTPAIEWPGDLSFDDDAKPKPISPTITPAEAAASRIVEYKRPEESDEKWRRDPPSTPGEHQVRVVIPANANRNFVGVTKIVGFTIKEKPSGEHQQVARGEAPPESIGEAKVKKEFYLALSFDALKQAKDANIWPADDPKFERQDWSKDAEPEHIQKDGSLETNAMRKLYEMEDQIPIGLSTSDPDATFKYVARSPGNEVHLIGLTFTAAAGDFDQGKDSPCDTTVVANKEGDVALGNTNVPVIDQRAIKGLAKPKVEVTKTSGGKTLQLSGLDEIFKEAKLLPQGAKWILRVDLSQFKMSGYLNLTASTPGLFSLQDNLRRLEEQKTRAETTINQAAELSKQAADAGVFFETNKKLIVDEFNNLNEKYKLVAASLIEGLKNIQPPRTKEDQALSQEEKLKALLINALKCALDDQAVGGWMQFSEKGREKASQAGENWLKNLSESESLQLRPEQLSDWLELDPAERAGVASVKGIAEKWLDARIKSLKEPPGNPRVEKEDVKEVLNALKHGIRRPGVSGQNGATALSDADVKSARDAKDQAEKQLAFLETIGTSTASGSAQLLIEFPPEKGSQFPPGEEPVARLFVLLPDVALKPGAETPN
jgi:hypothetical protein